jgi:hypothetical protein
VLSNWGKKIRVTVGDEKLEFVLGQRKKKKVHRKRAKVYGTELLKPLKKIWYISGYLCGKLLKKYIQDNLDGLIGHQEIKANKQARKKLLRMSAATIDRMLKTERKKLKLKARAGTKPGTLLKSKIPIRTYQEWDEKRPGFFELDLVNHNGGDPSGEFIETLDATDIHTTWTETEAVRNKARGNSIP